MVKSYTVCIQCLLSHRLIVKVTSKSIYAKNTVIKYEISKITQEFGEKVAPSQDSDSMIQNEGQDSAAEYSRKFWHKETTLCKTMTHIENIVIFNLAHNNW